VVVKSGMVFGNKYLDPGYCGDRKDSREIGPCYIAEFECNSGSIWLKTVRSRDATVVPVL
jgi:hypothetical protein